MEASAPIKASTTLLVKSYSAASQLGKSKIVRLHTLSRSNGTSKKKNRNTDIDIETRGPGPREGVHIMLAMESYAKIFKETQERKKRERETVEEHLLVKWNEMLVASVEDAVGPSDKDFRES